MGSLPSTIYDDVKIASMKFVAFRFLGFAAIPFLGRVKAMNESPDLHGRSGDRNLLSPRIVGGTLAGDGEFPFYAIPNGDYLCGSAMIHDDILISAAHCEGSFAGNDIYIGGILLSGDDAVEIIQAEYERKHPMYDGTSNTFDFMLIKLKDKSISPIVPWNKVGSVPVNGQEVVVMGFGDTSENGQISDNLKKASVYKVSFQDCQASYADLDDATMFCAYEDNTDSCQGDR